MSVDFIRSEVTNADPVWQEIRDITEAENLTRYLREIRRPNGTVDEIRTEDYQKHAIFYGVSGRTGRGLVGTIFHKDPAQDIAPELSHVETNIDGGGNGIQQQARAVCADVVRFGRCGLWVDFPRTKGPISMAETGRYFATVTHYKPWQITNWRQERDGSEMRLVLVVLKENRAVIDGFRVKSEKIYRELALVDLGAGPVYRVRVWVQRKDQSTGKVEYVVESEAFPTDSAGRLMDFIPFTFVGSQNNDPTIDSAPLAELVKINIGHYRNSADYEDSVFYSGQVQPWMSGATSEYFDLMNEKQFYIGSKELMPVPPGEQFGFATPGANPLVRQAMIDKIDQMVGLGASIIERGAVAKTATEAASDDRTETSELSVIAGNVSRAYESALRWAGLFQGASGSSSYVLCQDFSAITATAQMLTAWVGSWLQGAIPFSDYCHWLKRNGFVDASKTEEQIRDELEDEEMRRGAPNSGAGSAA